MANTYTLIASSTVGSGGTASISFSSISSAYTDLKIVASCRSTAPGAYDNLAVKINSLTSGYTEKGVFGYNVTAVGNGNSTSNTSFQTIFMPGATATANTFSNIELYSPNYLSSNAKSMSVDYGSENNGNNVLGISAELQSTTSSITTINLSALSGSLDQYSTFYLYGIKNS